MVGWRHGRRSRRRAASRRAGIQSPSRAATAAGSSATRASRGLDTVTINAGGSAPPAARWTCARVLARAFHRSRRRHNRARSPHRRVGDAFRRARRACCGGSRRSTRFELQRSGRLALKLPPAGLIVSTERELHEATADPGWSIPTMVAPLGVDAARVRRRGAGDIAHEIGVPQRRRCSSPVSYDPSGRYRIGVVFRTLALLAPRHPQHARRRLRTRARRRRHSRMHAAALGVSPIVTLPRRADDEQRVMRAASVGWVVVGRRRRRVRLSRFHGAPRSGHRRALAAHAALRRRRHHRAAARARRPSYTASSGRRRSSRPRTKRVAMGNAGRARVQRDFPESGDDRRIRARRERGGRPDEMGDEVTAAPTASMQPTFAHRAEYAAIARRGRGHGTAQLLARRSHRRADRRLGLLAARHPSRGRRAAARAPRSPSSRATRSSASRARRTRISAARASRRRFFRRTRRREIIDLFEAVSGWELVEERLALGKGLIVVTGHLGNWELGRRVRRRARFADRRGRPPHGESAVRPISHATRQRIGMTVVHDEEAVRRVPRSLRTGRAVAFLVDQGAVGLASTWVPFFGRLAKTPRGPAVFALAARRADGVRGRAAPAVGAVSSHLRADRRRRKRAIAKPTSTASSPTTRAVLERWVRRAPEQYFWHHRRWKHQRPGTPPELGDPL